MSNAMGVGTLLLRQDMKLKSYKKGLHVNIV